jgi:phosphatidylinositol glycan class M
MWYICLFPLILPSSSIQFKWKGLLLLIAWAAGQGLWLNFAYQLEFLGQNTFLQLWIAGVFFFVINCWIVVEMILSHQYERIYGSSGRIRWVWGRGDPGSKRR